MSAWSERNGGSSAVAGSGSRTFNSGGVGLPSGVGGVYRPTPSGPAAPPSSGGDQTPGVVSINVLDPAATSVDPISQLMDGLRQATVGGEDSKGVYHAQGIGGIPVLGNLAVGAANAIGGAGEVFGGATAAVGGALERIPSGAIPGTGPSMVPTEKGLLTPEEAMQDEYDAIANTPEGAEFRAQYDEAIAKEEGLFGTGLLDDNAHWKSLAIRKWREDQQYEKPTLAAGAFTPPGSLSDTVMNMFDVLGVSATVTAKGWAQLDTEDGLDRLDLIEAVGDEERQFEEDKGLLGTGFLAGDPTTGLNDMEQLIYAKYKAGDWTRDQAMDFIATNQQAYGHSAVGNIAGYMALDPINIATLGAGVVAKFGGSGALQVSRLAAAEQKLVAIGKSLEEANAALRLARGVKASKGVPAVKGLGKRAVKEAKLKVEAITKEVDTARESVEAFKAYHHGGNVRRLNPKRLIEGSRTAGSAFRMAGKAYGGLEGTSLGRAAKVTRTLIDPFHAIDLANPNAARFVDLYSDSVPRSVVETLGVHHYKGMLDEALRLDPTRGMYDQLTNDIAVASTNLGREGVIELYRAGQMAGNLGEALMKTDGPEDLMSTAIASTKHRDLQKWLRYNALKHVQVETWTKEAHQTLARGLEQAYHMPGPRRGTTWMQAFKTMSKEQKSLYKFAVYGSANRNLIDYVATMSDDVASLLPFPKQRMVLLAKGTLTRVGGESLLTALTKTKSTKKRLALIDEWQQKYASLRYVSIDSANLEGSVDNFIQYLEDNLDRLPMQMTNDELAALGDDAEDLLNTVGEYSLGFRPEDRFLWGLERESSTGLYRAAGQAWADHVGDGAVAYRPAAYLRTNIAGHPLVGVPVVRAAVRAVDHIDSAARLMKSQVTSAMVMESARKRFIANASTGELGQYGVTERIAQDWFERITSYTREHPGYSGPRGMGGDELYKAIREKNLIPQPLLNGERRLAPADVMRLVLEAYDGDMRYLGLTQKLSGRAKRMLFETWGSNWAGQIAEHAWPTLKFRYNPIFQLQEKIEPWVLNAQRGVSFATGVNLSEADRATERILQRMTDNSLVRQADLDQFEYSSAVLFGKSTQKLASSPNTVLNRIQKIGAQLTEVQGMKRVNMLRTFRKGLAKELRQAWDEARPGDWDKMKEAADLRAGRILNDDDFALQIVSENAFANDVFVNKVLGKAGQYTQKADWSNSIKTGVWMSPTTLGELKALDLEHVAASLRLVNGKGEDITDLNQLRQALATEQDMMDKVVDGLARLGADKDYIRRVRNGLDFSWGGFWKTAEKRFGLSADESARLQTMMAQAADLRGMNPVEFMSQVFSPSLIDGTEGVLGHLEGTVRVLREARAAGRKIKPREAKLAETRTRLAGKEGVSTRDDLVRQLAKTFSAHLDPSARRALLMEFDPVLRDAVNAGTIRLDLMEVQKMWDEMADNQLADRILGYMDGKLGDGAHDVLTDATRGVSGVRDGASAYMRARGVTPQDEVRYFKPDEDFSTRSAAAYRDLPETPFEQTGRRPTIQQVNKSSTELKPRPDTVDERTYAAYQDFVVETRAQYDHMTAPKNKGGMGLKVIIARGDPYPNSAAMRADVKRGQIRVFAGSSDHPLMTNEQNVMFRAVHDVFGHAAEGFEFGPRGELNAAVRHSQMYGDTSRAAMLTETHGQNSYVNFSDDVVEEASATVANPPVVRVQLDAADPLAHFEKLHGERLFDEQAATDVTAEVERAIKAGEDWKAASAAAEKTTQNTIHFTGKDAYGHEYTLGYKYTSRLGEGIRGLPADQQALILQPLSDLLQEFPELKVFHFDMVPFNEPLLTDAKGALTGMGYDNAGGLTWGGADNPVIILNSDALWKTGKGFTPDTDIAAHQYWAGSRNRTQTWDLFSNQWIDKRSNVGTPEMARPYTIGYIVRHETGHAFDSMRRRRVYDPLTKDWTKAKVVPGYEAYHKMMSRFEALGSKMDLSEYGMSNSAEFGAELFAFATDPRYNADMIAEPALRDMAEEYRAFLFDSGEWKPVNPPEMPTERPVAPPSPAYRPNPQKLEAAAKEVLTVTDNIEGAHFMTPDGTLVRGYGEHYEAAAKLGGEERVRDAGFVRISGSSRSHLNFDISRKVTDDQRRAMLDAASTRQTVTIDLHEGRWYGDGTDYISNADGFGYEHWSNERVINTAIARAKAIEKERFATYGADSVPAPRGATPPRVGGATQDIQEDLDDMLREAVDEPSQMTGAPGTVQRYEKMYGTEKSITYVLYDDTGKGAGFVLLSEREGKPHLVNAVETRKDVRRQGIATHLYERAAADGFPIEAASDTSEGMDALTTLGRQFRTGRRAKQAAPPTPLTVAEANKAKPGSVYAKQKAALLPQDILDEFGKKFVGRGKHIESNPDVARTAQMFGKWTEAVVGNGLLRGEHGVYSGLLHDVAGLPTGAAVPYNYSEGAIANLATQSMVRKWDDAFRLQYFSQERSFLERSLNHPMFGMYPASYMWGKIMPEMVRFLAAEPFGNKTGGLLYSAMDVQASIAMRREYDPYFDAHMEQLGHSQAMSFGGYLMPSLPWDISASAPGWMRSISDQGRSDADRVNAGQDAQGISLLDPAVDTFKKLAPLTTTLPWMGRAADELNGPADEAETRKDALDLNKAVKAAELQPTMQRVMQELQEALR